ncbi:TIGR01777 family oxidoreductase [Egicoccus halophilus]|uniref:Epimerase n=1 Tax=Egicoccus halophilus TaxID=1670830 RepID=A0A8J3ESQ7_9ACTN|nr:TIGR01777 family oxidoreductase [Egicoccus halophilus]GGI07934.1 epimerase [Egicoccus halophilus]
MRIAITGATGLIGRALTEDLQGDGHQVVAVTRDPSAAAAGDVVWDPAAGHIDAAGLEGLDGVVHLAGEPIGDARWSEDTKRRIHDSRVQGTTLLARTLVGLDAPPPVLVSGSAVGFYGDRGDEVLTEVSTPGDDFLAGVCADWEAAAEPARAGGIRVVHPRTGVVIAADGPLIDKIELPFKLGVGGKVGSGRQYVPWISLTDEVRALRFLLEHDLEGPVNLTGPEPVTNAELTRLLGEVLRRPTVLPIPTFAVTALYGEMGRTLASVSQRAVPQRLLDAGFRFVHGELRGALREALRPAA